MSTQPQTTAIVKPETSPLIAELAHDWKITPATMINTLKATIFPQTDRNGKAITISNEMMVAFLQVCNAYTLNPFVKEIYAFPTKGGGIVPMVPIDGWANIINRNPNFDGIEFVDEWEVVNGKRALFSTTCIIYRKDRSRPIKVTEYMQECFQPSKDPWIKWPARMLRHKSMIQCARVAFSLAGIYDPDEAERIAESGDDKKEIKRPTVIDGATTTSSAPAGAGPVEQKAGAVPVAKADAETSAPVETSEGAAGCFCSCCKNAACDCLTKEEFDRCGCANCQKYMSLMKDNPEKKDDPEESPTVAQEAPSKPSGPYVPQARLKKLFAICAAKGIKVVKDSHDDDLHKMLREKWGIASVKEIPESQFDAILKVLGEGLKVQ